MKKSIGIVALSVFLSMSFIEIARAKDTLMLPPTAKLLDKAGIMAAYDGKKYSWSHPNTDKVTGTANFDLKNGMASGVWNDGKTSGEWEAKVTFKGDQYCFEARGKGKKKYNKMVCNLVYLDSTTTYELDPKTKRVLSIDNPM
jgi:hypothetical protein